MNKQNNKIQKQNKIYFHIVSIFPDMVDSYFSESIISQAIKNKLIIINKYAIRDYTKDKHRRVDGKPYGGGPGMVLWVDPIINTINKVNSKIEKRIANSKTESKKSILYVITSPGGEKFDNNIAKNISKKYKDIVFVCGRYEGIDDRVREILKAKEYSIGDYVLTGGELPAMVMIDCISRQIDGVLNDSDSIEENRISSHKVYARPEIYEYKKVKLDKNNNKKIIIKKYKVPPVLLSGNHKLIDEWKMGNNSEE